MKRFLFRVKQFFLQVKRLFNWRTITDIAKRQEWPLRLADRLGRGHGRMRLLDTLTEPPPAPLKPDLTGWENESLAAVWIGHATVLLRVGGKTILTDPVLSNRIGLGMGLFTLGPRRHMRPALTIHELPPIDLVLLSHAHFDHLDLPTLARLSKRITVIAAAGVSDLVGNLGFREVIELRWGETTRIADLRITAKPVVHWGARTFRDTHRGYCAFLIESQQHRVLYGADTAYHEQWRGTAKVDLAILGIGAYDPYVAAHATPEQALAMADHVGADSILPIHHSTFTLSREPRYEPIKRLLDAVGGDNKRVVIRRIGESFEK
ncbi:MAG: MBL fold metallo-hydrolase [Burkholderiales bacterium]|nr:MBL fold metallo-hydrolase [Phycisphaerae bacterium]